MDNAILLDGLTSYMDIDGIRLSFTLLRNWPAEILTRLYFFYDDVLLAYSSIKREQSSAGHGLHHSQVSSSAFSLAYSPLAVCRSSNSWPYYYSDVPGKVTFASALSQHIKFSLAFSLFSIPIGI